MDLIFLEIAEDVPTNGFDCGRTELNGYLQNHALVNHRRGLSMTVLALQGTSSGPGYLDLLGFYTLAAIWEAGRQKGVPV